VCVCVCESYSNGHNGAMCISIHLLKDIFEDTCMNKCAGGGDGDNMLDRTHVIPGRGVRLGPPGPREPPWRFRVSLSQLASLGQTHLLLLHPPTPSHPSPPPPSPLLLSLFAIPNFCVSFIPPLPPCLPPSLPSVCAAWWWWWWRRRWWWCCW